MPSKKGTVPFRQDNSHTHDSIRAEDEQGHLSNVKERARGRQTMPRAARNEDSFSKTDPQPGITDEEEDEAQSSGRRAGDSSPGITPGLSLVRSL